jgi:hypothetical protein
VAAVASAAVAGEGGEEDGDEPNMVLPQINALFRRRDRTSPVYNVF